MVITHHRADWLFIALCGARATMLQAISTVQRLQ